MRNYNRNFLFCVEIVNFPGTERKNSLLFLLIELNGIFLTTQANGNVHFQLSENGKFPLNFL